MGTAKYLVLTARRVSRCDFPNTFIRLAVKSYPGWSTWRSEFPGNTACPYVDENVYMFGIVEARACVCWVTMLIAGRPEAAD